MNNFFQLYYFFIGAVYLLTNRICRCVMFLLAIHLCTICPAQQKFDFYVSNNGNDSFPGTAKLSPKKTIANIAPVLKIFSAANGKGKLGLKEGDIFNENLITSYPIEINTYGNNSVPDQFAILNGTK